MVLDASITAFFIFVVLLLGVIYYKRRSLIISGVMVMYKTQRGKEYIDSLAKRHPRFWHHFGTLGVAAGVLAIIFMVYVLLNTTIGVIQGGAPGVALVLPGSGYSTTPGAIFFPWYVWILAVGIMFIPHELSHAVICRRYGIKVKSVGLLLLAIFPGAFVEPDEKQLKRAKLFTRLRVYAVGSFTNIVTAGAFYLLLIAMLLVIPRPFSPVSVEILNSIKAIVLVTLGVGLFNALPIYPLDGGKFFHDIVEKYSPKGAKGITLSMSLFLVLIVVFNLSSALLGTF
ncbi:MAG: site-2 protease family protein [Candidatus Aenigmarchaeota archaeon]|nr:site-2 protease family protein [Candidatus Aenigmarchaeota archaeon]